MMDDNLYYNQFCDVIKMLILIFRENWSKPFPFILSAIRLKLLSANNISEKIKFIKIK